MFSKILLPLDGSRLAERALGPALALASNSGNDGEPGEVILLRVPVAERMFVGYPAKYNILLPEQSFEFSRRESLEYLETIQKNWACSGVNIRLAVTGNLNFIDGNVAGTIVDTAVTEDVDLIAMSTHGHSGFTRWMLGSVTERVLRHTTRPVLAIRSGQLLRRVLIPLDGSELAEDALPPGMAVSRKLGDDAILLRVEPPVAPDLYVIDQLEQMESGMGDHVRQHFYTEAESYLEKLARPYRQAGQTVEIVVTSGNAAPGILEVAEAYHIDLIVIATHGRTGLSRWVYGSVTEKVLRGTHCSTLVIRPAILRNDDTRKQYQQQGEEKSLAAKEQAKRLKIDRELNETWKQSSGEKMLR